MLASGLHYNKGKANDALYFIFFGNPDEKCVRPVLSTGLHLVFSGKDSANRPQIYNLISKRFNWPFLFHTVALLEHPVQWNDSYFLRTVMFILANQCIRRQTDVPKESKIIKFRGHTWNALFVLHLNKILTFRHMNIFTTICLSGINKL